MRCLGTGLSKARLPVWSRDGTRIAYIDEADPASALAMLVVIDQHGQVQSRIAIKPIVKGEVPSGMRFVESLEWIGNDRVVASGSVNPSSTENLVFDLLTHSVVGEYIDDARGAAFSPDGRHVLLVDGSPHFAAAGTHAPALRLDGQEVLEGFHADSGVTGQVRWSADGTRFALTAHDATGKTRLVLGHAPTRSARWVDLPAAASDSDRTSALFWSGSRLHLQRLSTTVQASTGRMAGPGARSATTEEHVLDASQRASVWKRSTAAAVDPVRAAAELRSAALMGSLLTTGAKDADVWCSGCALDKVARRHGVSTE